MNRKSREKDQTLQLAIQSYQNREYTSVRACAKAYGLNESSLRTRLKNGENKSTSHAYQQLLTPAQEQMLVQWILDLDSQGHAPSHAKVREMAQIIRSVSNSTSNLTGSPPSIGHNWVHRFKLRNPKVATLLGKTLDSARVNGTSSEALREWFALFEKTVAKYHIQPCDIYNMDETGIALGACCNQWVLGQSNKKQTYLKSPENREWVTIVETIGAQGQLLQPLVIFKGQGLQSTWFPKEQHPDWKFAHSPNGWTSSEIAISWLREIFLPQRAQTTTPTLLVMDGHKTHCTLEFMWECFQNNVKVLYLPAHSSHVTQPLDLSCFSTVKKNYRGQIADLAQFDDSAPVKKIQFCKCYKKARQEGLTSTTIKSGWKAAGLVPFNPDKVYGSRLTKAGKPELKSKAPGTPQKVQLTLDETWITTPQNIHDFRVAIRRIEATIQVNRPVRTFLRKVQKAMSRSSASEAKAIYDYKGLKAKLDSMRSTRGRTKVQINPNSTFANIEDIMKAQKAEEEKQALYMSNNPESGLELSAKTVEESGMESFLINFQI